MTQKSKKTPETPVIPVSFSQPEARLLFAMDGYIFGNQTTRVGMGGDMQTIEALVGLYGDVTMLQVHYHLEMFRFRP